jgi:hypothetical protein
VSSHERVFLYDRHEKKVIHAEFIQGVDHDFAKMADDMWVTYLATAKAAAVPAGKAFENPQHAHWRWAKLVEIAGQMLSYPTFGIAVAGVPQGLMMLKTDGAFSRFPGQERLPIVEVAFLATAPWNLQSVVATPRFAGVGTILLRAAVETSFDLGFKGRVGLLALRQAETFYERHDMTCFGVDSKKPMKYYEMTTNVAEAFVREESA